MLLPLAEHVVTADRAGARVVVDHADGALLRTGILSSTSPERIWPDVAVSVSSSGAAPRNADALGDRAHFELHVDARHLRRADGDSFAHVRLNPAASTLRRYVPGAR